MDLPAGSMIPPAALNRARRALTRALSASGARVHATTSVTSQDLLRAVDFLQRPSPPPGLMVLCRTLDQALAAHDAGVDGVYLDFLALTGLSRAVETLRARGARCVGVAPPRIRKPGEEKIDRFLYSLEPDMVLVRGLGMLMEGASACRGKTPLRVGDFSLNITNRLAAAEVLRHGLDAFTPSFDLNSQQLGDFLHSGPGHLAELVIHHPMPLFHMEHCLFAALLSRGTDFRNCGRPCEQHTLSLRDRVGLDHPVEADIGCRNTVFHAQAQSAASLVAGAQKAGTRRFRVELVRESPDDVTRIIQVYRALLDNRLTPVQVFTALKTQGGYGVVRGSLRVLD